MFQKPLIMGVLNVTPDSFSDGGKYLARDAALRRAEVLMREGADIVDVGGESTRPGAEPVVPTEELDRVIRVVEAIRKNLDVRISIDTRRAVVAREALACGATLVNDVSAGSDPEMLPCLSSSHADVILMHMQGDPQTMQKSPEYPRGVVLEVISFLEERTRLFESAGVDRGRIRVDPGVGFGKTLGHNLALLRHLDKLSGVGSRVVIGTSRKSFLAALDTSLSSFEDREAGTLATNLWAFERGASVFRVHEVASLKRALRAWEAVAHARAE